MKKSLLTNFITCGLIGWCFECFWTGLGAVRAHKDPELTCHTSIWMFPIYGSAALLKPLCKLLRNTSAWVRGGIYTICIFLAEFTTGEFLKKYKACPWDYSKAKWNIKGVIRLDYAPLWFIMGLFYEKILLGNYQITKTKQ